MTLVLNVHCKRKSNAKNSLGKAGSTEDLFGDVKLKVRMFNKIVYLNAVL